MLSDTLFFLFYDFSLNFILLLLWKILKSDRNEYYGISVWKTMHSFCVRSSLREQNFMYVASNLNCQDFFAQ